jgi:hypothetical protein
MGAKLIPQSLKIKTISYTITMPAELKARLTVEGFPKGQGGWQSLVKGIQSQIDGDTLELSQGLLDSMIPKATEYGAGGYQSLIRWILCLLLAQHGPAILGKSETIKDKVA